MPCEKFCVHQYINEDGKPFSIGKRLTTGINQNHFLWTHILPTKYQQIAQESEPIASYKTQQLKKIKETALTHKGKCLRSVGREVQMIKQIIQGENNGRMA